jgi:hypothetical protein
VPAWLAAVHRTCSSLPRSCGQEAQQVVHGEQLGALGGVRLRGTHTDAPA